MSVLLRGLAIAVIPVLLAIVFVIAPYAASATLTAAALVFALAFLFAEAIRYWKLRKARAAYPGAQLPYVSYSLAGLGASSRHCMFRSQGGDIFTKRPLLAASGLPYLLYTWSLSSCLPWVPLPALRLVLADGRKAAALLCDSGAWVKEPARKSVVRLIGSACTSVVGSQAARQRRALAAALGDGRRYAAAIEEAASRAVAQLGASVRYAADGTVNVGPVLSTAALDFILSAIFGFPFTDPARKSFTEAYLTLWDVLRTPESEWIAQQQRQQRRKAQAGAVHPSRSEVLESHVGVLAAELEGVVSRRRASLARARDDADTGSAASPSCVLDSLLACTLPASASSRLPSSGPGTTGSAAFGDSAAHPSPAWLTHEELVHNMYSLLNAGFETTAHTATVTLLYLAEDAGANAPGRRGAGGGVASADTIAAGGATGAATLRAAVREALRLASPVPQINRCAATAAEALPSTRQRAATAAAPVAHAGGVPCAPGTVVTVDLIGMHRCPAHWGHTASEFRPQRWLAPGGCPAAQHWLPFGAGPKSCIGQALALLAVERLVGAVVKAFELRLAPGYRPRFVQTATLRLSNGLQLQLRPRAHSAEGD